MKAETLRLRGLAAVLGLAAGLAGGCATIGEIVAETAAAVDAAKTNAPPAAVTNAPPPPPPPPPVVVVTNAPPVKPSNEPDPRRPQTYAAGFLWKPESEGGGPLVVLYPAAYTGHIAAFWLEKDGKLIERGANGGVHNGDRFHARYSKRGGAYPAGTAAVLVTDAGVTWRWTVQKTGSRNDGTIVPTAVLP
jgi:hypothetical protein